MRLAYLLIGSLGVAGALAGCASTAVNKNDQAAMARFDAFRGANITLPMGTIEAAEWALYRDAAYEHLAAGEWRELADLIQRKGINNDLNWYYLGRAAEGMAEMELARQYYQRSIDRSGSDKASHKCQGAVISLCDGFEFPDVAVTRLSQLQASAPPSPQPAPADGKPAEGGSGSAPQLVRTGTGFVIDNTGSVVTNYHVVQQCGAVSFLLNGGDSTNASVLASDPMNDLALLHVSDKPKSYAVFQDPEKLRSGDDVIVFGYPLLGQLASTGNLTKGSVTALSGLRDDTRYFQMSAPIQLGNSGGPVLNHQGRVVGIVTSKLNAARELKATGDISQNVNFALKAAVLRTFLDSNNVNYNRDDGLKPAAIKAGATTLPPPVPSAADVGKTAEKFTGIVGCYKN
ncbi:MAG: serine protease [Micropepsaceae bacterium]